MWEGVGDKSGGQARAWMCQVLQAVVKDWEFYFKCNEMTLEVYKQGSNMI